ncbi:MAG: hypothetical protein AAGF49_05570 [Pseudomonadota bacterium]
MKTARHDRLTHHRTAYCSRFWDEFPLRYLIQPVGVWHLLDRRKHLVERSKFANPMRFILATVGEGVLRESGILQRLSQSATCFRTRRTSF